jgi:NAD(P)-dependent dehydrogenase (short-subunit alcohol dehydrogenase family)
MPPRRRSPHRNPVATGRFLGIGCLPDGECNSFDSLRPPVSFVPYSCGLLLVLTRFLTFQERLDSKSHNQRRQHLPESQSDLLRYSIPMTVVTRNQNTLMDQLAPSASFRLENQVSVVTGGARGIGAGIVRRFVQEGARVVFSDLLNEEGKRFEEELGKNVAFYRADAASASDSEALVEFAVERFGRLDCVVNNAGAGGEGEPVAQTSVEDFDRSIALLLRGPFLGIKYAVPRMQSGGTIINIASVNGLVAGFAPHAYTAAKFGVVGLTKSVALELAERGIRVNAICPGGTATWICAPLYPEMPAELVDRTPEIVEPWLASGTPIGRAGLPADIANVALWLASSESSFVTGHALVVDGGFTAGTRWSQTLERLENLKEHFRAALNQTAAVS